MVFNLNEFLMALSFTLDFVEIDILGVTSNHGKRTAYISLRIAKELGMSSEELHDIVSLAMLHDNGVSEKALHDRSLADSSIDTKSVERVREHCTIGEDNISKYPFLTDIKNVIKYHHENFDGSGLFHLKGDEIPLMSQIIRLADMIEVNFHLEACDINLHNKLIAFITEKNGQTFSSKVATAFLKIVPDQGFWRNLKDDLIDKALKAEVPQYIKELSLEEIRKITGVFSKIIDSKSEYTQRHSRELSNKAAFMADYYKFSTDEKMKLMIAADLHDIGKLAVPNHILDSPNKLSDEEFSIIKKHTYYTRLALQEIKGFEDITEWASNHHEKLNGKGYPYGKNDQELDFNSRLIACLDIYEALTEERPYRKPLEHKEAMKILYNMCDNGFIDLVISKDIDVAFNHDLLDIKESCEQRFQPVLMEIDNLLKSKKNNIIIAIDGKCASGKTTLGYYLQQFYECNLFHMDDFFLREDQKTIERGNEIGGNVDYERFKSDVIDQLQLKKEISYRKYNCKTKQIEQSSEEILHKRLNIIEGSYSQHPYFGDVYDLRIFMNIDDNSQLDNIRKRNGEEMLHRFIHEWIPKENAYFDKYGIKEDSFMINWSTMESLN
jgi:HD-GYP domain-containing protein (c-di-GMP phosphodiesterase class II)/uridine kinase